MEQPEVTEVLRPRGAPPPVERLGRYRLERFLGTGNVADAYVARALGPAGFDRPVVIKRVRPHLRHDERFVKGFLQEARLLAHLHHVNITQIFELEHDENETFVTMEYLEGVSLQSLAARMWASGASLPLESVVRIVADVCAGLDFAHNARDDQGKKVGLVHRDVSPAHLFVTTGGTAKILDFGMLRREGSADRQSGDELARKLPFLSPEALRGEPLDRRADVFSVGVVLYWLLTGRLPFTGATDEDVMTAILEANPTPVRQVNPRIPVVVAQVVHSALIKDKGARTPSCAAVHEALSALLIGLARTLPSPSQLVLHAQTLPDPPGDVIPERACEPLLPWPDFVVTAAGLPTRVIVLPPSLREDTPPKPRRVLPPPLPRDATGPKTQILRRRRPKWLKPLLAVLGVVNLWFVAAMLLQAPACASVASTLAEVLPAGPTRVLHLTAPEHIRWLSASGELLGLGTRDLVVEPDTATVIAFDRVRGVRVEMTPGEDGHLDYGALPRSTLTVKADPPAQVILGNENLGKTPLTSLSVVPGHYSMRIMWDKREKIVSVDVLEGTPAVVTATP